MAVQVREVASPIAHPGFPERQDFSPEQIITFPAEEYAVYVIGVVVLEVRVLLGQGDDEVASDPVGTRVGLVLVHDLGVPRDAARDFERDRGRPADNPIALADGALVLDGLAAAAAGVARGLDLLEHARGQLVLHDAHAVAAAVAARVDDAVGRARAVALLADLLLLPRELGVAAVVEVAQRDAHLDLDVVPPRLPPLVVSAAAEEPAEQVEGVVVLPAALAALLEPLVAVLVVYLTRFGIDQGFVGLGDLDEFVLGGLIATVRGVLAIN